MGTQRTTGVVPRDRSIRIWFMWKGKRQWETLAMNPTPPNIRHAVKLRQEICTRIALGVFDYMEYFPDSKTAAAIKKEAEKPTFREVAEKWLVTVSDLAHSTTEGYKKLLMRYPYPEFGDIPIDQIRYSDIAELLGSYEWGSMKTRNNAATVIRQPFEMAFIDGLINTNPASRIKNMKYQKQEVDPFSLSEIDAIIQKMIDHGDIEYANYIEFAAFSGMRTSELLAMEWPDIDFNHETARVNKAKVRQRTKATKNYRFRYIELNSRAMAALRRQAEISFMRGKEVFTDPKTGKGIIGDKPIRERWKPALRALGIRYRPPYNTRHTFATLNLMAGANPMWVSRQLGHTSMKMLLEVYSRWIDGADQKSEKNKLENLINVPIVCQAINQ